MDLINYVNKSNELELKRMVLRNLWWRIKKEEDFLTTLKEEFREKTYGDCPVNLFYDIEIFENYILSLKHELNFGGYTTLRNRKNIIANNIVQCEKTLINVKIQFKNLIKDTCFEKYYTQIENKTLYIQNMKKEFEALNNKLNWFCVM